MCYVFVGNNWAVAVDNVNGFVYWTEFGKIRRTTFDGHNTKIVFDTGK